VEVVSTVDKLATEPHRRAKIDTYGYVIRWGTPMLWGTPILGNVTALEGLHVTGKYRQ
jgi:hypothetical protein